MGEQFEKDIGGILPVDMNKVGGSVIISFGQVTQLSANSKKSHDQLFYNLYNHWL